MLLDIYTSFLLEQQKQCFTNEQNFGLHLAFFKLMMANKGSKIFQSFLVKSFSNKTGCINYLDVTELIASRVESVTKSTKGEPYSDSQPAKH